MVFLEIYRHFCSSSVLSERIKTSKQKPKGKNTLFAEDETGACSCLSELLLHLGFHEKESSVQL